MATSTGPMNSTTKAGEAPNSPEPHGGLRGLVARHRVVSFFALAYLISWPLWGLAALGGGQVIFLLGGLGPLISAIVITGLSGRP
jgi:hypothetical protein